VVQKNKKKTGKVGLSWRKKGMTVKLYREKRVFVSQGEAQFLPKGKSEKKK